MHVQKTHTFQRCLAIEWYEQTAGWAVTAALGFDVRLVGDACETFPRNAMDGEMFDADVVHRTALASLHGEFCTVLSSENALMEAS